MSRYAPVWQFCALMALLLLSILAAMLFMSATEPGTWP